MNNDFEQNLSDQVLGSLNDDSEQKTIKWLSYFLAFLCIAAFIAVIWYLYSMSQSIGNKGDNKDVAVITAPEGPVKVKPDNPGGMKIPHQDKLVFQTLLPEEKAQKETVLPKPEKPIEKSEEDEAKSLEDKIKMIDQITEEPVTILLAASDEKKDEVKSGHDKAVPDIAVKEVKKPAAKPSPVMLNDKKEEKKVKPVAKEAPKLAEEKVVKVQPQPKPVPKANPKPQVVTSIPDGTAGSYRVQLGAYRDMRVSVAEGNRLKSKFDVLSNLMVYTPKADLGPKGAMYRVQLGPLKNRSEAERVCSNLKKSGQGCFIARK